MRLVASAAALGLLVSLPAFAQTPPAAEVPPPAAQAPSTAPMVQAPPASAPAVIPIAEPMAPAPAAAAPPAWNSVMKEELLVDSYYMYNFTGSNSRVTPAGRNYDVLSNSFALNYAKFAMQVDSDPVMVRVDLGYGQLANLISGGSVASPASSFAAQQAFASLKVPGTQLTIDFGRFNTTAGAEVIEANRNWLYSRSFLFAIIPVTHTGVRLGYKINDMVSVQASLVNGIINDFPDNNAPKTGGLSITVAPLPTTSVILTSYIGKEGLPDDDSDPTHVTVDFVVAHNVSDQFGLNLNIDYVKGAPALAAGMGNADANAVGFSLMAHYVANEHLNLSARGEFLKDKSLLTGIDTQLYEGTVGLAVPFAGHFEARAELRGDFAKDAIFPKGGEEAPSKNQFTGTVAFLGYMQ